MSIYTESLPADTSPTVLTMDNAFLVIDPVDKSSQEVQRIENDLSCDCFTAQVSQDRECQHVRAVREHLSQSALDVRLSQADADYYLSRVAEIDGVLQKNSGSAEIQRKRIDEWECSERTRLERRKQFYLLQLDNFMHIERLSTKRLVHGTIKVRSQQPKIEVLDEDLVLQRSEFHRVIPERIVIDKKALRKHILETGEEVPGTLVITNLPHKFSYKLEEES